MRKFLTFVVIGILIILNLNFIQGSYQSFSKLSEISEEQSKVRDLEVKNSNLKQELEERNSTYFIEQEARNRLGYSRVGETSILVESSDIRKAAQEAQKKQKSNLESWLDLVRS